ncbi:MAG: hypothetical protein Hens3KO_24850 [Henriciella sp.]
MKATRAIMTSVISVFALTGCIFGGNSSNVDQRVVEEITGGSNPYLWRASLDTLESLPLVSADPLGGTIIYDWKSYEDSMDERIKATVYILDSRLRADGVKVSVFRQVNQDGTWSDASVDADTGIQLENAILRRARNLKASELN